MTHYRELFDPPDHLGVWDLDGAQRLATIVGVTSGTVGGHKGKKKSKKAVLKLAEFDRPFLCNVTNARTIAGLYGENASAWRGKLIALYPTTTRFGGEEVPCIRVRPTIPTGTPEHVGSRPVDDESRAKQDRASGRSGSAEGAELKAATTDTELALAIHKHAAWINERDGRWDAVLTFCRAVGLAENDAKNTLAEGLNAG